MSKEEIKNEIAVKIGFQNFKHMDQNSMLTSKTIDILMDTFAQSLAKEVIEELDFAQSHNANYKEYDNGLRDAIAIIKTKFNLI